MSRFIHALGIRNVGEHLSKILASVYDGDMDMLINSDYESLIAIDEVGDIVANSIISYFQDSDNLLIIKQCFEFGIIFIPPVHSSNILKNKTFVITGTLPSLSRQEAKNIITSHGGTISSSISKKTDFLLCGKNPGSKFEKAENLNVNIINEIQLKELIK